MMPRFRQTAEIVRLMGEKERIRNIGMIAHIDHGKTTTTDSLLIGAGLLAPQIAGSARVLDYLEEEQKRGITIKTANISFLHKMGGRTYVINLVDTPGHVDFAGKVTRALRAIDGAVVVVDAVEEIMAQTETVTRQALEERVKPVLFINKVDRLIRELNLSKDEAQDKFSRIINGFNSLIETYAEPQFRDKWKVDPAKESVVFGSALHKWGSTQDTARERGIDFNDIMDAYKKDEYQELSTLIPLHNAILNMAVKNIPNPIESQQYRVPKIWRGDVSSEIGRAMLNCEEKGPTVMCITMAQMVPDVGLVATGRLFSGSVKKGDHVCLLGDGKEYSVQQVFMYMSAFREVVDQIGAGNIAALIGVDSARSGDTLIDAGYKDIVVPFERGRCVSEPVMTIAIEPKNPMDLPSLAKAMNRLSIEDPNLVVTIEKETGQYKLSGMGELHLEIAVKFLAEYSGGIELTASKPIVAYRESVSTQGRVVLAKSSNKKNEFWVQVEPLESKVVELMEKDELMIEMVQEQINEFVREKTAGFSGEKEKAWSVDSNGNVLINCVQNVQSLAEAKDSIVSGFRWACSAGPLCEERLRGVKVKLMDARLHEDPEDREPAEIMRATSRAILGSCLTAKPVLLEPIYKIALSVNSQWLGNCLDIIIRRRGKIQAIESRGQLKMITGYIPVTETFRLSVDMRSATSGRAFWQLIFDHWERIPENLVASIITQLREKRGLPAGIPKPEWFVDEL